MLSCVTTTDAKDYTWYETLYQPCSNGHVWIFASGDTTELTLDADFLCECGRIKWKDRNTLTFNN